MWELRSVGLQTDLFIAGLDSEVIERERYLVVRTPSNPGFWWGNFLIYPEPPDRASYALWLADHARELPGTSATLLTWDRPEGVLGEVEPFIRDGFVIDDGTILTATSRDLRAPPRIHGDLVIAPIERDAHWDDAARVLTNAFAARRSGSMEDLRGFVNRQIVRYRAMQAQATGQWYGAFVGGELAGTLGLVRVSGSSLGRFQLVGTDPRFARMGVCSTLVFEVARRALEELSFTTLVMAADAEYHAAKIYESVGFRQTERLLSLLRKPPAI